jgi:hypothetical protein
MDPLNTFPWTVAMRWWSSDEPLKENFHINMSIGYRRQTSLLTRQQFLHGIVSSQQSIWHVHRDEMYRRRSRFWAGIASLWIA